MVVAILLTVCILPFVSLVLASLVANLGHCRLDEGGIYRCLIAGVDVGATLSTMSGLGWVGLAALPLLPAMLVVWAVVELIARVWRRRRA
jgi:hypothetical protein